MDTQSKVTVKALSTIKHGVEDGVITEYNAGDIIELTVDQAAQLIAVHVVEVSDQVKQQVAETLAASDAVVETQTPDTTVAITTVETVADPAAANPSAADIATTLNSVELQ